MKQGYILTEVSCRTCGMNLHVEPVVAASLDIVKTMAANIHTDHNATKICPKPLLLEIYLPCLVSNEIFNPAPQLITTPNGH